MKKLITILCAAALLAASVPAAVADSAYPSLTLDSASALVIADDGYIDNMTDGTNAAELLANFRDRKNVTVTSKSGDALSLTDVVGSDAVLSYNGSDGVSTAKTWMLGDLNGDAGITTKDVSFLLKDQAGYGVDFCRRASDVNADGTVNAKDIAQLMKYLAGWQVTIAKPAYTGIAAEHEDAGIGMYFTSIMDRVAKDDTATYGTLDYVYRMAKNEIETAEMIFTSDADKSGLTLEVGELVNENGAKLDFTVHYGYYYKMTIYYLLAGKDYNNGRETDYVDPLVPYEGTFDLAKDQSMTFAVRIHTAADSEAGLYKSDVILRDADGNEIKRAVMRVFVWDFALDDKTACETAFGLGYGDILEWMGDHDLVKMNSFPGEVLAAEYAQWYEYLVDNRISPYDLPVGVESAEARKYIDDPRVTTFCAYGGNGGPTYDETKQNWPSIAEMFTRHKDDENWIKKAYIYSVDEPCSDEQFDFIEEQWRELNRLMPDVPFRIVTPLGGNSYNSSQGADWAQTVFDSTNIMCPSSTAFTVYMTSKEMRESNGRFPSYQGNGFTTAFVARDFGQFADRWEAWRDQGKSAWWYVCIGPQFPFANFFNYYQGNIDRILFWQQYYFHVDGLLYWDTTFWLMNTEGYVPITRRRTSVGDGLLLYPPQLFGLGYEGEPVPSIRLESVRDGIEDFQYFAQLERELGRDAVLGYVSRNTDAILHFTEEADDISNVRDEIGFLLESMN